VIPHHRTRTIKIKEEKGGLQRLKVSDLEVSGKKHSDQFCCKEVKKTMTLPKGVECDELVSFMTQEGKAVLGVPLKICDIAYEHKAKSRSISPLRDVARDTSACTSASTDSTSSSSSSKMVSIKLPLPQGITSDKIDITVAGRELIMRCVDKAITADSSTRISVLNTVTLPENTDLQELKCVKQNNVVMITAPLLSHPQQQQQQLSATMPSHMPPHIADGIQHIFGQADKSKKKNKKKPVRDQLMPFQELGQWPFAATSDSDKKKKFSNVKARNILI